MTQRRFVVVAPMEIDPEVTDPWGMPCSDALPEAEGEVGLVEPF